MNLVSPFGIVSLVPQNITERRGETVSFTCSSDAGPMNRITWFHNDNELVCNEYNCSDGVFILKQSDAGMFCS